MLAVGALVPLSYGRLGKSWRHAERLQELAKYDGEKDWWESGRYHVCSEHISNVDRLHMLEEYWEKNRIKDEHSAEAAVNDSPVLEPPSKSSPQPNGYRRPRAISDATAMMTSHQMLSPHHPAISLPYSDLSSSHYTELRFFESGSFWLAIHQSSLTAI